MDGREIFESPSFGVQYTQMLQGGGIVGPIPKIQNKKVRIEFDPTLKQTNIYEQPLDSQGNAQALTSGDRMASVGMDGVYKDINSSKFPGLDASLAD